MPQYGIYSENDGKFVEAQFWSAHAADAALASHGSIADGYSVMEICADHDNQPASDCDECFYGDEEGDVS